MKKKKTKEFYTKKDQSIKAKAIANQKKILYRRIAGRHK